jgi:hypothetical protein
VIRFSKTKNIHPAEIHKQIVAVCGEGAMNEENESNRCRMFKEGKTNVHDWEGSGSTNS